MIDYETKKKLLVELDKEGEPMLIVSNYGDADALDDILSDEFDLDFSSSFPRYLDEKGGRIFHFEGVRSIKDLQSIIDSIKLNEE